MKPIRLILVALKNLGPECHRTVMNAARLARGLHADLELFHVIDEPLYADISSTRDGWMERAQQDRRSHCSQKLERIATRLRRCGVKVGTAVEWDHPVAEAIIRRGMRSGSDLIVAERHHGWQVAPSFLHPTERDLLRLSPVPTLLAAADARPYRHPIVLAAVDPSHSHAKPPALDEEILRASDAVNQALGGTLHVLHAYEGAPGGLPLEMQASPSLIEEMEATAEAQARKSVARLLAAFETPVDHCHVVGGRVKDAIRDALGSNRCPLIVMGAVPRSGLHGLFVGNTAERFLDEPNCDLLVVKPPEFECHVPRTRRGARFLAMAALP